MDFLIENELRDLSTACVIANLVLSGLCERLEQTQICEKNLSQSETKGVFGRFD